METQVFESFHLVCTSGGSNKFYRMEIHRPLKAEGDDHNEQHELRVQYGAIGGAPKVGSKGTGDLVKIRKLASSLMREKVAKGYELTAHSFLGEEEEGSQDSQGSGDQSNTAMAQAAGVGALAPIPELGNAGVRTGFDPVLLRAIDPEAELHEFVARCKTRFTSLTYMVQLKYDGERRALALRGDGWAQASNRSGLEVPAPTWAPQAAADLARASIRSVWLDGELIGDVYVAFDVMEMNGEDLRSRSLEERLTFLRQVSIALSSPEASGSSLKLLVAPIYTLPEALDLMDAWRAKGEEGFVIRSVLEPYTPGRGGESYKVKFWNSATVVCAGVSGKEGDYRTAEMLVWDRARTSLIPVGRVTLAPKVPSPQPGSMIEVRYLFSFDPTEGGRLFQPTYIGERKDLGDSRESAGVEQLVVRVDRLAALAA